MKAIIRKEPSQSSCPRPRAAAKKGFRLSSQLLCGLFSAIEVARGFLFDFTFHNRWWCNNDTIVGTCLSWWHLAPFLLNNVPDLPDLSQDQFGNLFHLGEGRLFHWFVSSCFPENLSKSFFHIAVFVLQPRLYTTANADIIISLIFVLNGTW